MGTRTEFGGVGLTEGDGSGGAHPLYQKGVFGRDEISEQRGTEGRTDAGGGLEIFVGHGKAMEAGERFATRLTLVGCCCIGHGAVGGEGDDGVHLRVYFCDASEVGGEGLSGG